MKERIKVFDCYYTDYLEKVVNCFIESDSVERLIDIKYSCTTNGLDSRHFCIVVYVPKVV